MKGKDKGTNLIYIRVRNILVHPGEKSLETGIFPRLGGGIESRERKNSSANTEEDSHPIKQLCLPSLRTRGGGEVEVASGFTTRG